MTSKTEFFQTKLKQWGKKHAREFPWRGESNPFKVLVAEILLQRSRATSVKGVYIELFRLWPEPGLLAQASEKEISNVIKPLGLTKRAATLKQLAEVYKDTPSISLNQLEELLKLPGVGKYSANVVYDTCFGGKVPTVDSVSSRVYRRFFISHILDTHTDKTKVEGLWNLVEEVMPSIDAHAFNWYVLDLASAICLPKKPRCLECPLVEVCTYGCGNEGS